MGDVLHGRRKLLQKNNIITSKSTLETKPIFKFSYLQVLPLDPLCTTFKNTLKKDPYSHLPLMSKCHPVWKKEECFFFFFLLIASLSRLKHHEAELGRGTWQTRQAKQACKRADCLPHDNIEEPLESEVQAKADWKRNHFEEYNMKNYWKRVEIIFYNDPYFCCCCPYWNRSGVLNKRQQDMH